MRRYFKFIKITEIILNTRIKLEIMKRDPIHGAIIYFLTGFTVIFDP